MSKKPISPPVSRSSTPIRGIDIPSSSNIAEGIPRIRDIQPPGTKELETVEVVEMPTTTRLKYKHFKGDGVQHADDWLEEFIATSTANEETKLSKKRVFQGLLQGEALKWYNTLTHRVKEDWEILTTISVLTNLRLNNVSI